MRKSVIPTDPGTMETEHQQFRAAWGYTYRSFNERVLPSFSWTCPSFPPRQHTRAACHQSGLLATRDSRSQHATATQHTVGETFGKQVSYPHHSNALQEHYWWQLIAAAMLNPGVPDLEVLPSLHKLNQVEKENLNKIIKGKPSVKQGQQAWRAH